MNRSNESDLRVACLFAAAGVVSRIIPHPPNFAAITALALFSSFYLTNWKLAPCVTVLSLLVSDAMIGTYEPALMATVYIASLTPLALGRVLRRRLTPGRLAGCAIGSSLVFFVTTNLAIWLFTSWYATDWAGLVACFGAAVPFFRYTLTSDFVFSGLFFGSYAVLIHRRALARSVHSIWIAAARLGSRHSAPCSANYRTR